MNRSLSVDLILHGGMLLGLSILAHNLSPHAAAITLWAGIAGGVVSALLGVLGLRGCPIRRWSIAAMTVLSIVLFAQAVTSWLALKAGVKDAKSAALILTLLCVVAFGQLVNLIQNRSGLPFADEPEHRDETGHDD